MTRTSMLSYIFLCTAALWIISAFASAPPAEAGIFERIKSIYKIPAKVNEFRSQYDDLTSTVEGQKAELEATRQAAVDSVARFEEGQRKLQEQNNAYRQQNEALQTQNELLAQRLELLEQEKESKDALIHKAITIAITLIGIILLYFVSMRVLRLTIWRREKRSLGV
ncbi:hypothetical protein EBB07_01595 [Paenibacillaceae bacterium]|nr:hypothetical protein EBB07_01595 [Paenibacillaceae bacterium]